MSSIPSIGKPLARAVAAALSVVLVSACGNAHSNGALPPLQSAATPQLRPSCCPRTGQVTIEVPHPGDPDAISAHVVLSQNNAPTHDLTFHLGTSSHYCQAAKTGLTCGFSVTLYDEPVSYTVQLLDTNGRIKFARTDTQYGDPLTFVITNLWSAAAVWFDDPKRGSPSRAQLHFAAYYSNQKEELNGLVIGAAPFLEPIPLTSSDKSGATRLSASSLTSPSSRATLWYDGKSYVNPIVRIGGRHEIGYGQMLLPFVRTVEYPLPHGTLAYNYRNFSRIFPTGRSMTFLADRAVGSVASGSVSLRPMLYTHDIARGPDNVVWALVNARKYPYESLVRINADGTLTQHLISGSLTDTFAFGADGNFWLGSWDDQGKPLARRVTPDGSVTDFPIGGNEGTINDVIAGPDGNVWYLGVGGLLPDSQSANFIRVTPSGTATIFQIPGTTLPCCSPTITSPVWAPDGNLYTVIGGTYLGRITPSGRFTEFKKPLQFRPGALDNGAGPPMSMGPDGAIWYDAGVATGTCNVSLGRATITGSVAFVQMPAQCGKNFSAPAEPDAFSVGPYGSFWYTRGSAVGKIVLK